MYDTMWNEEIKQLTPSVSGKVEEEPLCSTPQIDGHFTI